MVCSPGLDLLLVDVVVNWKRWFLKAAHERNQRFFRLQLIALAFPVPDLILIRCAFAPTASDVLPLLPHSDQ